MADETSNPFETPENQDAADEFAPIHEEHQRADQVDAKAIAWLDPEELGERIPLGMITLVGGRPGQGKSLWSADIAARISKRVGAVIFSNMEDPLGQVVRPRLEAAGADLSKIHFWNPILPRDTEALRTMILALQVKCVVIDPIAAHLTVSIYNDQEVRQALSPLKKVAEETGCAIVMITHTLKSVRKGAHPLEAIGGSGGGLPGAARVVYIWGPDPEEASLRALGCAKMNLAPMPPAAVYELDETEWILGEGDRAQVLKTGKLTMISTKGRVGLEYAVDLAIGVGRNDDKDIPPEKKAIAAEWLEEYLAAGARPVNELREDAAEQGIAWRTMRRASDEVGVHKTRRDKHGKTGAFGPGSSIWWELPPGHHRLLTPQQADSVNSNVDELLAQVEAQAACCDKPQHEERFNSDGKLEIYCANCNTIIGVQEELPASTDAEASDDADPEGEEV